MNSILCRTNCPHHPLSKSRARRNYPPAFVSKSRITVAGCRLITYEWSDWRNKMFWWIQSVYVKPEHRGHGVYRAMEDKVQELAAQAGNVCGFRLYVHKGNTRAQEVYRTLGMNETEYLIFEDML